MDNNKSQVAISQHKMRTFSSLDQNLSGFLGEQSKIVNQGITDLNDGVSKTEGIIQWLKKVINCIPKRNHINLQPGKSMSDNPGKFFMFGVQSIGPISIKKSLPQNKLFMKMILNLYSIQDQQYCCRTMVSPAFQLQEMQQNTKKNKLKTESNSLYTHQQKYCTYFYTYRTKGLYLKVDCMLYQGSFTADGKKQAIFNQTYLGTLFVNTLESSKARQEDYLCQSHIIAGKSTSVGKSDVRIQFNLVLSDGYRLLEKLIPPDCIVNAQDQIGGIMGKRMPLNQYSVSKIQFVELYSLKIDLAEITIPTKLCQQAISISQCIVHGLYPKSEIKSSNIKQYRLGLYFHNGWHVVNKDELIIREKMQIQRNSKQFGQVSLLNMKNQHKIDKNKQNNSTGQHQHTSSRQSLLMKFSKFTCDNVATLPFVFIADCCMLVMEVTCKIEVKFNYETVDSKGKTQTHNYSQILQLPLCCSYHPFDNHPQSQTKYSQPFYNTPDVFSPKTYVSIPTKTQLFSQNNSRLSNIDYFLHMSSVNKMEYSQHLMVQSKVMLNDKDKVYLQKERIAKENRKIKKQFRKRKIQINQEIPLLDTTDIKQHYYLKQLNAMKEQRKQKQQILHYLKQKCQTLLGEKQLKDQHYQSRKEIAKALQQKSRNRKPQNHENAVYYKTVIRGASKINEQQFRDICSIKIPDIPVDIQPPLQILKTQIQQANYSYLFFINILTLLPLSHLIVMPRRFIIRVRLFTQTSSSKTLKINELTGEVSSSLCSNQQQKMNDQKVKEVQTPNISKRRAQLKSKLGQQKQARKKTQKNTDHILHIQVSPSKAYNNQSIRLKMIQYMYNGYMEIQIVDYQKNMIFGRSYFELRQLIRKRRNQVTHIMESSVFGTANKKGKLKIEVRSLRKQPNPQNMVNQNATNVTQNKQIKVQQNEQKKLALINTVNEQSRQLMRINRFKERKNPQAHQKEQTINRLIENKFLGDKGQISLLVTRMQRQIFFIEVENGNNVIQKYRISINDQDQQYLISEQGYERQCQISQDFSRDGRFLGGYYSSVLYPPNNVKKPDLEGCIQLGPNERASIPFEYYSKRKYLNNKGLSRQKYIRQGTFQQLSEQYSIRVFNHSHTIIISLIGANSSVVNSLHKVNIIPTPDFNSFTVPIVRKQKTQIQVKLSQMMSLVANSNVKMLIDDPMTIVQFDQTNQSNDLMLQCISGQIINKSKNINISLIEQQSQNQLAGKILRNINLEIWSAEQICIQGILWQSVDSVIQISTANLMGKGVSEVLIMVEDQKFVQLRQKNPVRLNKNNIYTFVRLQVNSNSVGKSYHQLNVCHPVTREIMHRFILKIQTPLPVIKQYNTLNLRITDYIIDQPFSYRNPLPRKTLFKVITTRPDLLYSNLEVMEIQGKSDKKFTMKIAAKDVDRNGDTIIIGFKSQRSLQCFMFSLVKKNA